MGKIVMPKNSALLEEVEAVLKIYFEASDWLLNDEYKEKLKSVIGDDQYSSSYTKKAQITSYFGFTEWEDISNPRSLRRITKRGRKFYEHLLQQNQDGILEDLMVSLEQVTFGRGNFGCPDSDSDVEPPVVFVRAALELGYLTYKEFAYLLWRLEDNGGNYTDVKREINDFRKSNNLTLQPDAQAYTDAKPIMVLIRWGFLTEDENTTGGKHIIVSADVRDKFEKRIRNLKIYNIDKNIIEEGNEEPKLATIAFSPEWFAQKALLYLDNEVESERLYQDFREKFGPDALRAVDGLDLLHKIFINETRDKENLCYTLEFSKQYTQFGGIGGGSALKYGLYFDAKKNSWVTGTWKNLKILTVDEAIELGTLMRDEILAGVNIIQNHAELKTAQDYLTLNAELFSVMPTTMNKAWVMKYFHMMFPDLFPPFYNLEWQDKVLTAIDEESDDNSFVRIGKIALFIKKCGISSLAFSKVVYNMKNLENSEEEQEAPIVTTNYTFDTTKGGAQNKVVYGTPGCGKSYYVQNDYLVKLGVEKEDRIRTTFYQDYTNTDFVGQILPKVVRAKNEGEADEVTYEFNPGPFALALKKAIEHSDRPVALIIEELNRGNAASIFGDIFQLLDRDKNGKSQYDITNTNLQDYLTKEFAEQHYIFNSISLPGNLYIVATMNTSDQNVFTLDTAFKRRWQFEKIRNKFTADHEYKGYFIPGMEDVTWEKLVDDINDYIVRTPDDLASEDKQLGVYFIDKESLCKTQEECSNKAKARRFAYKLFEYLWDDVAKYAHSDWFNEVKTLDELIDAYIDKGEKVFVDGIIKQDN